MSVTNCNSGYRRPSYPTLRRSTQADRVTLPCRPGNPLMRITRSIMLTWSNVKSEIIRRGELPHLPGVPHLHVNRPLIPAGSQLCQQARATLRLLVDEPVDSNSQLMKLDYMEIGGLNAKSPVLIADIHSPSSSRFFASLPLSRLRLQRKLITP